MNSDTVRRLIELNFQFYQTFAHQFSDTRKQLQPGVQRIVRDLPDESILLDLGCGNGELGRTLARSGRRGAYVGLDFSKGMLETAITSEISPTYPSGNDESKDFQVIFLEIDISNTHWHEEIPHLPYNFVFAFAVLHHLPGYPMRLNTLCQVHKILNLDGYFIHSEWQFLNSPRLRKRILPWETIGLSVNLVDTGDYLLDWKQGGYGLRYVHHFAESELTQLADESGFHIDHTFLSDGKGHNLGLYQIWKVNSDKIV
jgi:SAM-dependent methyltransferase